MAQRLIPILLSLVCSGSFAQEWTRPEGCTPAAKEQARQALLTATKSGVARPWSTVVGHCTQALCPPPVVNVAMQGSMCVASLTIGLLRIPETDVVDIPFELQTRGICASPSQCRFDDPTGITILSNQGINFGTPVITPTKVTLPHLPGSRIKWPVATYEPHVWLERPGRTPVTCCPIDPKMINDN